jgi:hypothetical protein
MDIMRSDQLEILKMLLTLSEKGLLEIEYEINLMKRLLVLHQYPQKELNFTRITNKIYPNINRKPKNLNI